MHSWEFSCSPQRSFRPRWQPAPGGSKQGDPVTIYTIGEYEVTVAGSSNPEVSGAVEARAKAINKAGGLKDATGVTHKLKVVVCNTNNDPNLAEQCARDAVDDDAAAVVGMFSTFGPQMYPILEAAQIPVDRLVRE